LGSDGAVAGRGDSQSGVWSGMKSSVIGIYLLVL
jgi:hypothetical protein